AVPLVTKGVAEADGSNVDANYFLGIDGTTQVLAADFEDTATGGNHPVLGVTKIWPGVWYHVAATYDGTTWKLYVNGNLDKTLVAGAFTPRFDSIQHAGLGAAFTSAGVATGAFQGQMDEPRIWNVARSQADIQANMNAPLTAGTGLIGRFGLDEGAGTIATNSIIYTPAVNGTLTNGPVWVSGGTPFVASTSPGAYGLHFSGTAPGNEYVTFGQALNLGAATFTVETWFRREGAGQTTTTGGVTAIPLVTKGRGEADNSNVDMNYFLGINPTGGPGSAPVLAADWEEMPVGATVGGANHPINGVTPLVTGTWYHAAVTYDGTNLSLYLNGALEATMASPGKTPRFDSIQHAALASAPTSTGLAAGFFNGSLDEARIWNYARTQSQILSGKDREIPAASGLLGRWSFNQWGGATFVTPDSSGNNVTGTMSGPNWTVVSGASAPFGTGTPNAAPTVDAGANQTITMPDLALLNGSVSDDLVTGSLTIAWTKTSGPGTVTFFNASAANTSATFSATGAYVLTLSANDGELSASKSVNIQVNAGAGANQAPIPNAGPDQTITLPAQAVLTGSYTDDGLPGLDVQTTWSKVSGPGTATLAQPAELNTTATFSSPGTYVLMLAANDGALSGTDTLTVTVNPASTNAAIDFTGTTTPSGYITFGQASGLGAATFTLEAWIRRDGAGIGTSTGSNGLSAAIPLITKGRAEADGDNRDMNYFLGIDSTTGVLAADFEEGIGGTTLGDNHPIMGVTAIQNNVWNHVAATYDGNKWQLFLNGNLEKEVVVGRPPRSDSIQHAAIGSALTSTGAAAGFFNGVIDEVRIWNVARTQQQIQDGMSGEILSAPNLLGRWGLNENSGTSVADSSGHGVTGTIVGTPLTQWNWVPGTPFNGAINHAPNAPTLNAPGAGATGVHAPATLSVSASDPDGDPMTVTFYARQKPTTAPDFTLVTLPDTQFYSQFTTYAATFTAQTNWIVANRVPLNIAFVSHLGDVTQDIDQFEAEWQRADTSMSVLDANGIPYGMSPGNHDESAAGVANFYDQYFPVSRFLNPSHPWYIGYLGQEAGDPVNRQNKNNYELFSVGGLDFLVIHVEFDWPNYAVTWADKIIKRYPNRRVILSTHLFLNTSNARPTAAQFRTDGTSAEAVWQQIIKPNCNVFMVINGHYPGEGRRTDLNNCGQPVHQVLMDYQSRANGGDGWLRYFTFKPSENKIYAFTYSPTRSAPAGEFETDDSSQFVLDYDMAGSPFTAIAANSNVASGSNTTAAYGGLILGAQYEWYATANDGKTTTTGPTPVAANDAFVVNEDEILNVSGAGVLGNDSDADGDSLHAVLVSVPSHGALTLNGDGSFSYAPNANYNGPDSFTYKANDGSADSNVGTVSITVNAVNDAPVASNQAVVTDEDTAKAITLGASDVEGSALTYTIGTGPTHGTLSGIAPALTYTPAANYNGPDNFTFRANDGS
ncbi:MAG: hypothetical protein DMF91_22500, partial [Acidobacteria bacterium]